MEDQSKNRKQHPRIPPIDPIVLSFYKQHIEEAIKASPPNAPRTLVSSIRSAAGRLLAKCRFTARILIHRVSTVIAIKFSKGNARKQGPKIFR